MVGLTVAVFLVFGVVLARRASETKKEAIADLQREKEALAPMSLRALAEEEARDLGLHDMPGAQGVPPVVLLKVWKSHEELRLRCPSEDLLEFVVADGVDPADATEPDVYVRCKGQASESSVDEPPDSPATDPS